MADSSGGPKRPRAPTITVDTSAVSDAPHTEPEPSSAFISPLGRDTLAIPGRARGDSVNSNTSQSTTGSHTVVNSPSPSHRNSDVTHIADIKSEDDVWKPEDEKEGALFYDENSPFGVTRGHLSKLLPRKDKRAFYHLRGITGLASALRTNPKTGLPSDEEYLKGEMSFDDLKNVNPGEENEPTKGLTHSSTERSSPKDKKDTLYADRKRVFGDNRLPTRKAKSFFALAWEALQDKILILLCIAAVISLALGIYQSVTKKASEGARVDWVEGVAIMVAVIIVVGVGALNDWQKERQFKKLNAQKEDRFVKVIRSGKTQKVSVYEVFPGDVMILEQGDVLPCDGILIEGHNVSCDESSATGESDLMKKSPGDVVWKALDQGQDTKKLDPFIISGARVSEGVGTFLVTAVGVNSSHGKLMMALNEDTDATPLQYKLNRLASYIAKLGSAAGLLLFIVLFIEYLTRLKNPTDPDGTARDAKSKAQDFVRILIVAVTIVVVAVPEGLPLAVTLALAFATKRMTKDNNLVRHLQSCETMGNATVICSDKTGTLTQNVMTVVAATFGRGSVRAGDKDKMPTKQGANFTDGTPGSASTDDSGTTADGSVELPIYDLHERLDRDFQHILKDSIVINSTAFEGEEEGKQVFIGSKTETALLDFAARCFELTNLQKEREASTITQLIPFDSRRKVMGVVIKSADAKYRMFIKGASEIVLSKCTKVVDDPLNSTHATDLSEEDKSTLGSIISSYASMSLRTIGMGYRDFAQWPPQGAKHSPDNPSDPDFDDIFHDITWLSVVGIQDPMRKGVAEAVATCERAGVRAIMVTGDNVETARAIAKDCGILKEGGIVMEGPKLRSLSPAQLQEVLPKLCVVARSSPEDKKTLVQALRGEGHVVAVTGDGTNDAPALKAADVGFSMGIAGTEVAKEASDIILMDDNFSSIVKALAWGRTINDAVKKFLQFQITVNIVAVLLTFITAVSSDEEESVLNAVQLLWVNLIMDTFAALALATDPPAGSLFDRRPEPRDAPLITPTMWKTIIGQTIYQLIVTLVMFFAGKKFIPPFNNMSAAELKSDKNTLLFNTLIFNVFVWMQIFDALNCRRIDNSKNIFEGFWRNNFFMGIIAIMIGGQAIIVSFGGAAFVVTPIYGYHWAISIVLGFITLPIGFLIRCIPDRYVRIDLPVKRFMAANTPAWLQRYLARRRKPPPVIEAGDMDDDHIGKEWHRVYNQVHDDLALYKQLRGRRLHVIKMGIRHPRELLKSHRSRSGSRNSVLPGLVAAGATLGSVGGGITPDRRSINSRRPEDGDASSTAPSRRGTDEV
ncbi:calcium-translocating P-type ATPase [Microthyrium microscopicum]|uniref:Calcium-transporting ATPase n=1 Tax=Microthyrium microscopicum TaxID=703497 RepID=A0A6A6TXS8_9PEZI|nr:calcium-translocating P-type ATPase [Microthyrium microscopicum]